jgi:hypothetical protein
MPKTAAPSQCAALASQNVTWPLGAGKDPVTVAVIVRGVSAAKLLDDKIKVVVVGVALQKANGEIEKMNDRQIRMAARDPVLDIAGHVRPRAEAHDVEQIRKNERIPTRVVPLKRGAATRRPIDEPDSG